MREGSPRRVVVVVVVVVVMVVRGMDQETAALLARPSRG
jgi:hypothetical protein